MVLLSIGFHGPWEMVTDTVRAFLFAKIKSKRIVGENAAALHLNVLRTTASRSPATWTTLAPRFRRLH
jgi:hypothetical protein